MLLISQNYVLPRLAEALDQSRRLTQELETHRITLQQRVEMRTALMRRRAEQFQAVAQVGRAVAGARDADTLIQEAVQQIPRHFDFYSAAIYLADETGQQAVLQAVSGEQQEDQDQAKPAPRIKAGQENAVGRVMATSRPYVIQAADDDLDLPLTRPEIALPLQASKDLIGVLHLQARQGQTLSEEDLSILTVMADQLALSIENAHLLTETREALERISRYQEQEALETWAQTLLRRGGHLSLLYDQVATRAVPAGEALTLLGNRKRPQAVTVQTLPDGRSVLVAPIQVHGKSIGSFAFETHQTWEREQVALVEAAMQQISQALENARLLEEIQQRATREQLTGQITARMRETLDIDTVLQTAAHEIRETLGLAEAEVWMGVAPAPDDNGSPR
jgi:GAF domain-containing protein